MSFKNNRTKNPSTNLFCATHAVACTTGVDTWLCDASGDGGTGDSGDGYGQMPSTAIYVGGAGNLVVTMVSGEEVTFAVGPYSVLPIQCTKVSSTSTATGIVALFNRNYPRLS